MKKPKGALRLLYNFLFRTRRKSLAVKALLLTTAARLRVRFLDGSKLPGYLGAKGEETAMEDLTPEDRVNIAWVSKKVDWAARRLPWDNKCLVQAMVAQRLLRGYGLASTAYLGVGKDDDGSSMVAHSWVRCGRHYICGGDGKNYAVVARFAMYPRGRGKRNNQLGKESESKES